ncbi:hypothetical protein ACFVJ4_38525 [Streptomyces sp. NPDC127178]|uniref:hypothetical protein n=1 Tax=unclassified Streptomyces TaxID=2593676 RepID=UPI0036315A45
MELATVRRAWKFWDSYFDQLSLHVRWHTESRYVGEARCRIDVRRAGLRTSTPAGRLLPVSVDGEGALHVTGTEADESIPVRVYVPATTAQGWFVPAVPAVFRNPSVDPTPGVPDLVRLLNAREAVLRDRPWWIRDVRSDVLALPQSPHWDEAISTALLGSWADPLTTDRVLTPRAVSVLRAEARKIHRQLVPIWRRRTRHGRVLSLDADLGDGYCLLDLLAAQAGPQLDLAHSARDQQRIGALLRALTPLERNVVLARAAGEATTWTEAAMVCRIGDPEAFGNRVRRKVLRLIKEQERRRHMSNGQWFSGRERSE